MRDRCGRKTETKSTEVRRKEKVIEWRREVRVREGLEETETLTEIRKRRVETWSRP